MMEQRCRRAMIRRAEAQKGVSSLLMVSVLAVALRFSSRSAVSFGKAGGIGIVGCGYRRLGA